MAKIGEGHAAAMARLGLQELRNAANPSRESVAGTEIGLYGTATQIEINQQRGNQANESVSMDDLRNSAREMAQEQERHMDGPERDDMER